MAHFPLSSYPHQRGASSIINSFHGCTESIKTKSHCSDNENDNERVRVRALRGAINQ